jgi:predicted DCC family thiol-disulfide oxidoreductase YuxK
VKTLYILYDSQCAFCRRCRVWLGQQPSFVPLHFVPLQSPELGCRFPGIEQLHPAERLLVISDAGEVWRGESAWIMCLWALREYREWSLRLAHPALKPFARRVCEIVSENRHALSQWFGSESAEGLRDRLAGFSAPACGTAGYCKPR